MGSEQEAVLREEQEHLQQTLRLVDEMEAELEGNRAHGRTYLRESQGKNMASNREVAVQGMRQQAHTLTDLRDVRKEAYFARLDYEDVNDGSFHETYIGRQGLWRGGDDVVVDWRSPVGNLYYGGVGKLSYKSETGERVTCELHLKRQLEVAGARVKSAKDLYVLARVQGKPVDGVQTDQFLVSLLSGKSTARLKDIIASIQQEQNNIIRAQADNAIVLQGVAGSGKTTVALHRLAYLLYVQKGKWRPEQILVVAPSPLFLNYMANVLPSLGYKNVSQMTLQAFLLGTLSADSRVVIGEAAQDEVHSPSLTLRSVAQMATLLDRFAQHIFAQILPSEDIELHGKQLLTRAQIEEICDQQWKGLPPAKRLKELSNYLTSVFERDLENCREIVRKQVEVLIAPKRGAAATLEAQASTGPLSEGEILLLERLRAQLAELYQFRDKELRRLALEAGRYRLTYLAKLVLPDLAELYQAGMSSAELLYELGEDLFPRQSLTRLAELMAERTAESCDRADLAAIVYLRNRLWGKDDVDIKHVVVDEGQDLSPLEYIVLADLVGHFSFTIVGDVNQAIASGLPTMDSWSALVGAAFPGNKHEQHNLTTSYRNSFEITCFANYVLRGAGGQSSLTKPVPRLTEEPVLVNCGDNTAMISKVNALLDSYSGLKLANVAVLTKSVHEARDIHARLIKLKRVGLIVSESQSYYGGAVVMPVHLAKGLEFDCVIMAGVSSQNYPASKEHAKLLYVGITRAMHRLALLFVGNASPLLDGVIQYVRREVKAVQAGEARRRV